MAALAGCEQGVDRSEPSEAKLLKELVSQGRIPLERLDYRSLSYLREVARRKVQRPRDPANEVDTWPCSVSASKRA